MNAKNEVIQRFVDNGVNFNMATLMNKWIAKNVKLDKVKFDLTALCGSEKAEELYNETYTLYHETEFV